MYEEQACCAHCWGGGGGILPQIYSRVVAGGWAGALVPPHAMTSPRTTPCQPVVSGPLQHVGQLRVELHQLGRVNAVVIAERGTQLLAQFCVPTRPGFVPGVSGGFLGHHWRNGGSVPTNAEPAEPLCRKPTGTFPSPKPCTCSKRKNPWYHAERHQLVWSGKGPICKNGGCAMGGSPPPPPPPPICHAQSTPVASHPSLLRGLSNTRRCETLHTVA